MTRIKGTLLTILPGESEQAPRALRQTPRKDRRLPKISNLEGQTMGRKGLETRARLLGAALELLDTTPLRELRSADLAARAGISAANFYLYFENVDALVLTLAEEVADKATGLVEKAQAPWAWTGEPDNAEAFVRAYFDFWDAHRAILRIRNLAAEEGNWDFLNARMRTSVPLHHEIAAKIDAAQPQDATNRPHSLSLASIALAALERSAATYIMYPRKFGITRERLINAALFSLKLITLGPA